MIHIAIGFLVVSLTLASVGVASFFMPGVANANASYLTATSITFVSSLAMLWLVRRAGL